MKHFTSAEELFSSAKSESEMVSTVRAAVRKLLRMGYSPRELGLKVAVKKKRKGSKKPATKDEFEGGQEYDLFTVPDTILEPVADEHLDEVVIYDEGDDD